MYKKYFYHRIDSTQLEIWRRIKENKIENKSVIIADIQTNGKGTHGRKWYTDEGNNIAFSFFRQIDCEIDKLEGLTTEMAQIILDIFKELYQIELQIKLPNDIFYNGKKVGGILSETKVSGKIVKYIVIGIGINVNNSSFPEEISATASSLRLLSGGKKYRRAEIIEKIMEYFEKYYSIFLETEDLSALVNEYDAMLVNMKKQVKVLDPKEPFEGKAMGITKTGELIVDTWESRKLVSSGEVSVRGIYGYV